MDIPLNVNPRDHQSPLFYAPPFSQQDFTFNLPELDLFKNYTIKQTFLIAYIMTQFWRTRA